MFIPLTCVLISTLVAKTASSDFTLKGDPCSKFDSCSAKPQLRTCSCEDDCQRYGICCHDFKKHNQDSTREAYSCYSRRTHPPVFAKRSCVEDYKGHIDNKLACFDNDEDEMDVKNNLLVTGKTTKVTYWNKHCAKCNDELDDDLEFWNIQVFCPKHKNVNSNLIRRNLTFDQDKMVWGLEIDGEFLQCTVKYAPSPYINKVKHCTSSLISSCPSGYKNEDVVMKCSLYHGERKHKISNAVYKNIHCAICNGAEVLDLECPGITNLDDIVEESDFREMVEVVFINGRWLLRTPDKMYECSKGYSYDPYQVRCRRDETLDEAYEVPVASSAAKEAFSTLLIFLFFNLVL